MIFNLKEGVFMKNIFILFVLLLFLSCGIYNTDKNKQETDEQFNSNSKEKATIIDNNVRMRSSPRIDASIVTLLDKDTIVEIIGISEEKISVPSYQPDYWYNVRKDDGKEGWVFGGLLVIDSSFIAAIDKVDPNANNKINGNKKDTNIDKKNFVWRVVIDESVTNISTNNKYILLTTKNGVIILDKNSGKIKWSDKILNPMYIYSNDYVFVYLNYANNEINIIDLKKTDKEFKNVKKERIFLVFNNPNILPYFGYNNGIVYFFMAVNSGYELLSINMKGTFESKLKINYEISNIYFDLNNRTVFILSKDQNLYMYSL